MKRRGFLAGLTAAIGLPTLLKASTVNDGQILKFVKPVTIPVKMTVTFMAPRNITFGDCLSMNASGEMQVYKCTRRISLNEFECELVG